MTLQMPSELDSLIEPAEAATAFVARLSAALPVLAKSIVKVNVISIISIILLIGNSG